MFSISNNELNKLPEVVFEGMILEHQGTDGKWEAVVLEYGEKVNSDGSLEKANTLGVYKTKDGRVYLASVSGKLLERSTLRVKL